MVKKKKLIWDEIAVDGLNQAYDYLKEKSPLSALRVWNSILNIVELLPDILKYLNRIGLKHKTREITVLLKNSVIESRTKSRTVKFKYCASATQAENL